MDEKFKAKYLKRAVDDCAVSPDLYWDARLKELFDDIYAAGAKAQLKAIEEAARKYCHDHFISLYEPHFSKVELLETITAAAIGEPEK